MDLVKASPEQEDQICHQINTTREELDKDVAAIKEWLDYQRHLPPIIEDATIKSFIIGCKSSLQRTKEKLDSFYSTKAELPEYFLNRDPMDEYFQQTLKSKPIAILPRLTEDHCRVFVNTTVEPDPAKHSITKYIQIMLAVIEANFRTDVFTAGQYFIFDCSNFLPSHAAKITPSQIRIMVLLAEDVLPLRVKGVIFINTPPAAEFVANKLLKPFFKEKLARRVFVYKEDHSVLYKHFSKSILPKDYGGDVDTLENLNKSLMDRLLGERNWLLKEANMKTNEEMRPKSSNYKKNKYNFGLEGSFKQLSID